MPVSPDDPVEKAAHLAYSYEQSRGSCPQCVLAALMETLNIGHPTVIQASDSLAGGTALSTQGTCGALAGGMLALGLLTGRSYENFQQGDKKRRVFVPAQKLYQRFVTEYGSPVCKQVQEAIMGRSFDLLSPRGYAAFEEAGGHRDKCPGVAANVARWTAHIIVNEL
ncbi:MAG: C-GCAxxG-C-C family protein [Candidatus Thermoplasmatota archaeon]|nr:C-GCAxxG-C-C family protein [Candidatus Thermoplasmatota archaeon]